MQKKVPILQNRWFNYRFLGFSSRNVRHNKIEIYIAVNSATVLSLIWQHVSTCGGHFQASSVKYINEIAYNYIKFWSDISILQFDKIHVALIFVNNQHDAQFFFIYVYFYFLHDSDIYVPIIRRINSINTTSGICHSVWVTVWYAGLRCSNQTCISDSHPHRVT